jgi:hypothetical protein
MTDLRWICDELARWIVHPPATPPDWPAETWSAFRQAAQVHGVAPLLWLSIQPSSARVPPSPGGGWEGDGRGAGGEGAWLLDQTTWNARRVARLQGALAEILHAFAAEDVPILPVKGSVLAATLYEDPAARPMADLDVLLPEEHFPAGERIFARLGYEKTFNGWKHNRFSRPGTRTVVDREREHPDNPWQVEVHPRCRERILGEVVDLTDRIWSTARRGTLLGAPTWIAAPEAAWLHLLIHATHHVMLNNARLIQIVDLARLTPAVRDPGPLLAEVDPRATYPALALLDRYFSIDGVAGLRAALRPRLTPGFVEWADGLDLFSVCYLNAVPWRDGG